MTVAFDAVTVTAINSGGGSANHTPVGTPRGILVFVALAGLDTDLVDSLTYGGEAMTEVLALVKSTGEVGRVWCFFLGENVPVGTQALALTGSGSSSLPVYIYSLTAADDTEVVNTGQISSDSVENPSDTIGLSGRQCFVAEGVVSGLGFSFQLLPFADWTASGGFSLGGMSSNSFRYDLVSNVDVTFGWTQAADDAIAIAAAISELSGDAGVGDMMLLGVE